MVYIVKLSGGNRDQSGVLVDGEYGAGDSDGCRSYENRTDFEAARDEAKWFAERTSGGTIRIVVPVNDGLAVSTVEVVRS